MKAILIQARMGSTRLPGKSMKLLSGKPLLWHVVARCKRAKKADVVVVATSRNSEDDAILKFCASENIPCYRGSHDNVLSRYYETAKHLGAETIIRITSDCPLIDPALIDQCIEAFEKGGVDYVSNVNPVRTFPRGLDVEVFSFNALSRAHKEATADYEREHVTPYLWQNKNNQFTIGEPIVATSSYLRPYRLCVDYQEDFDVVERIYREFYEEGEIIPTLSAIAFLDTHPEVASLNRECEQKP
ncbi:MAG: glycosyltransferase family protein [bacterium]|nr:glycosyltransferase family protein [bacterium]